MKLNTHLKNLLDEDKTHQVIEAITDAAPSFQKDIFSIDKQIKQLYAKQLLEKIEKEEYVKEKNIITEAIREIIDQLPEHLELRKEPEKPIGDNDQKPSLWKRLGNVGLIIGILAGIVEFIGVPIRDLFPKSEDDSSTPTKIMISTGDNSPPIEAGGDVNVSYGNTTPMKEENNSSTPIETPKTRTKGK
ncbi:MAG: hypothetical protein NXI23_16865 [Bacteroidetes bacterium]|nr:hypothetical protein [Bacteroidota bacterium]